MLFDMKSLKWIYAVALLMVSAVFPGIAAAKNIVVDGVSYSCNPTNMHAQAKGWSSKYTGSKKKLTIVDRVQDGGDFYTVTSIANYAFYGEKSTTTVVIGSTVETIGTGAFAGSAVKTVTLPFNLRIIGESAFANTAITSVELPNRLQIIRARAFYNNASLTTVTGGSNVTEIGDEAFFNCSRLKAFNMAPTVTSLGRSAFQDCTALTSLTLSQTLAVIPQDAFSRCPIANLRIPVSVTTIGDGAFFCCATTALVIPGTVKTIGVCAFEATGCTSLSLGEGITAIGQGAFMRCTSLQSVQMPHSAVNVGTGVFVGCYKLATVKLAPTLKRIPYKMFYESGVKSVEIPEGVETVGQWAFYACPLLEGVDLPSTLRTVETEAFYRTPIKFLRLKEGLSVIGDYAFTELSCDELVIPASVTSIGEGAFAASFIKRVKPLSMMPPACGGGAFGVITTAWWLEVPDGTRQLYMAAPVWRDFSHIVEAGDAGVDDIPADTLAEVVDVRWFGLDGVPVERPVPGKLYIRVALRADGSSTAEKTIAG